VIVIISLSALLQADAAKSAPASLKDNKPPTIKITYPVTGSSVIDSMVLVKGTAADAETGIKTIAARVDAGSYVTATPLKPDWSSWQVSLNTVTIGSHLIEAKVTDGAGNTKSSSVTITVQDKTPPAITVPKALAVEAVEARGSVVAYTVSAVDNMDGNIVPSCLPQSGVWFSIGMTSVNCKATDSAGNMASASFDVVVVDTQAPHLSVPSDILSYKTATEYVVSAYDDVDGIIEPVCSPMSGHLFPVSVTTVVTCTATDNHRNSVSASFTVAVQEIGAWFYPAKFSELNQTLVDELAGKNINTLYFAGVNEKFKQTNYEQKIAFIEYARSRGMQVFAVIMQDPLYVVKTQADLQYRFNSIINATDGLFDSYVSDVEPHTICTIYPQYPCFSTNESYYLQSYIDMSRSLRAVADNRDVKYIDSVPWWYDSHMKNLGVSSAGLDALSANSINVLDYASSKTQIINRIPSAIETRYVVNIKVIKTTSDPWVEGQELQDTLLALQDMHLPYAIFEASSVLTTYGSF